MSSILCITFRFIQPFPLFHGRGDAGEPEWPPSPMRALQALLNATAMRRRGFPVEREVLSALSALEAMHPQIVAPPAHMSTVGYRMYVPHNQADLVAASWDRGDINASVASHRIEKDVRPMRISDASGALPAVHYLYQLDRPLDSCRAILKQIRPSVRSVTALGWAVDQVVADAVLLNREDTLNLEGEFWRPAIGGGRRLRVPRRGSLDALESRHRKFMKRLTDGKFTAATPFSTFDRASYRRDSDASPVPHFVFKMAMENEDAYRYPHAMLIHVAGMVRHAALERMKTDPPDWVEQPADWINRVVRGKRDESSADDHRQFSYVPLPSIGHPHADAMIRNVMIVAPFGMERELRHLARSLNGRFLQPEKHLEPGARNQPPQRKEAVELRRFEPPPAKFIARCYLGTSRTWKTVTPVILPGHDDKKAAKTKRLIQKALLQSGIESPCEFSWQSFPFLKNCISAHKYDRDGRHTGYHRPGHLKDLTAVHLCLTFKSPVPGPVIVGAGRHCGLGLFACE